MYLRDTRFNSNTMIEKGLFYTKIDISEILMTNSLMYRLRSIQLIIYLKISVKKQSIDNSTIHWKNKTLTITKIFLLKPCTYSQN